MSSLKDLSVADLRQLTSSEKQMVWVPKPVTFTVLFQGQYRKRPLSALDTLRFSNLRTGKRNKVIVIFSVVGHNNRCQVEVPLEEVEKMIFSGGDLIDLLIPEAFPTKVNAVSVSSSDIEGWGAFS